MCEHFNSHPISGAMERTVHFLYRALRGLPRGSHHLWGAHWGLCVSCTTHGIIHDTVCPSWSSDPKFPA